MALVNWQHNDMRNNYDIMTRNIMTFDTCEWIVSIGGDNNTINKFDILPSEIMQIDDNW